MRKRPGTRWKIQNNFIFIQLPLVLEIQQFSGLANSQNLTPEFHCENQEFAAGCGSGWSLRTIFGGPMKVLSWSVALHIFRVRRGHQYSMLTEYEREQSSLTCPNL